MLLYSDTGSERVNNELGGGVRSVISVVRLRILDELDFRQTSQAKQTLHQPCPNEELRIKRMEDQRI